MHFSIRMMCNLKGNMKADGVPVHLLSLSLVVELVGVEMMFEVTQLNNYKEFCSSAEAE